MYADLFMEKEEFLYDYDLDEYYWICPECNCDISDMETVCPNCSWSDSEE